MKELIEVFRMSEISNATRVRLIIKMGRFINDQYGANLTEPVVFELVQLLDPSHEILNSPYYRDAR